MAHKDDIRKRIKKLNPQALELTDKMDKMLRESGYTGVIVDTTSDMTPEEEDMALFEGYLKGGYSEDIASKKAKERLALINWVFDNKGTGDIKK